MEIQNRMPDFSPEAIGGHEYTFRTGHTRCLTATEYLVYVPQDFNCDQGTMSNTFTAIYTRHRLDINSIYLKYSGK